MGHRALLIAALFGVAWGVDHAKFRTCEQTGFCRRRRSAEIARGYVVPPASVQSASGTVTAQLHGGPFGVALSLSIQALASGPVRMRVVETNPLHGPRWEPADILEPNLEPVTLQPLTSKPETMLSGASLSAVQAGGALAYEYSAKGAAVVVVVLHLHPFKVEVWQHGERTLTLNPAGKFFFEHHRKRDDAAKALPATEETDVHQGKTIVDYGEDGLAVYSDGTKQQKASDAGAICHQPAPPLNPTPPPTPTRAPCPPPPFRSPVTDNGEEAAPKSDEALWEETFSSHSVPATRPSPPICHSPSVTPRLSLPICPSSLAPSSR